MPDAADHPGRTDDQPGASVSVAEFGIMELRRYVETEENQRFLLRALSGRQFMTENCVKWRDAETIVASMAGAAQWYSGREGVHPNSRSVGDTPAAPSTLQPANQGPKKISAGL